MCVSLFLIYIYIYIYIIFFFWQTNKYIYIHTHTRKKNAIEMETAIKNGKIGMTRRLEILFNKAKSFKTYRWGGAVHQ